MSKRRPNWSTNEIMRLVQSCISLLTGHAKPCDSFWKGVTEMINSIGGQNRSDDEVSRKWTDLKSQTKIKERKNRLLSKATGGGPPPRPLVDWEEMIINAMPNEVIEGLVGGTDTFCELSSRAKENTNTNKKSPVIITNEEPGSSTGIMSEDYMNNEENKKGKGKATKRKVQESSSLQERLIDIEEKKMKLKEEKLEIEKEKVETLKKISENISKIHILMKHKFIEDEVTLQFLEQ